MVGCTFCGEDIELGTGHTYVKKDAKVFHFCSRKCEKNMIQLKRKPRNTTWTAEYRRAKAQAITAAASKKSTKKTKAPIVAPAKTPTKTLTKVAKKVVKKAAKKVAQVKK